MKTLIRIVIVVIVACRPAAAAELRDPLQPHSISVVRFNLNPWGPLGFEMELAGDDPAFRE